ncbi:hypothetical protein FNH09_35090 [Streptomyces adustus]|uniref:Uncharacterized protein n=1 Tax=Streptomyces adustus TaxID=1609272 RepID=A0A5N8VNA3_9ACTN|nr:hypothetical protein [Streptomyces adustus]
MARLSWTSGPSLPPRPRKRHAVNRTRPRDLTGPRFRDVLPALAGTTAAVCAVTAALAMGYRAAGIVVPVAGIALMVCVVAIGVRRGRPGSRRRHGHYTAEELLALDIQGLALAVARMLRRDGWRVRLLPAPDRPRLCARNAAGHRLHVAFRPVAEPLPDEDRPHRHAHRDGAAPQLQLVVHRGMFQDRDIRWAHRQENTFLLDGQALRRWAHGVRLDDLLARTS